MVTCLERVERGRALGRIDPNGNESARLLPDGRVGEGVVEQLLAGRAPRRVSLSGRSGSL